MDEITYISPNDPRLIRAQLSELNKEAGEEQSSTTCLPLVPDDDDRLVVAEDDTFSDGESTRTFELAELIEAERCTTPIPEESWCDAEDLVGLDGPDQLTKTLGSNEGHNVQGMAGMAIDVLRDYYSIGPDATKQKACYAPFYTYLDKGQPPGSTKSTLNLLFKKEEYLKMFVHKDAKVAEEPEYDGQYVLQESVLWPKNPAGAAHKDSELENPDPNNVDVLSLPGPDESEYFSAPNRKSVKINLGNDEAGDSMPVAISDGDIGNLQSNQRARMHEMTDLAEVTFTAEPVPGPSYWKDLRDKLNSKMASGCPSAVPQLVPETGGSAGRQVNPVVGMKCTKGLQFSSSYQAARPPQPTLLSDSSSDDESSSKRRFSRTAVKPRPRLFSLSKSFPSQESLEYDALPSKPATSAPPKKKEKELLFDDWGEELDYELSSDDQEDLNLDRNDHKNDQSDIQNLSEKLSTHSILPNFISSDSSPPNAS